MQYAINEKNIEKEDFQCTRIVGNFTKIFIFKENVL